MLVFGGHISGVRFHIGVSCIIHFMKEKKREDKFRRGNRSKRRGGEGEGEKEGEEGGKGREKKGGKGGYIELDFAIL